MNERLIDDNQQVSIALPKSLVQELEHHMKQYGYTSLSDYVQHLLNESLVTLNASQKGTSSGFSQEDEERVKERLKQLGYLN